MFPSVVEELFFSMSFSGVGICPVLESSPYLFNPKTNQRPFSGLIIIVLQRWAPSLTITVRTFPPVLVSVSTDLSLGAPHVLQQSVTLREAVQGVIALAAGAHEAAQGVHLVLAGVTAVLVNLADGELHGGVVVGLDDAVGGAALAGDVAG
jgi:hypothetical protein